RRRVPVGGRGVGVVSRAGRAAGGGGAGGWGGGGRRPAPQALGFSPVRVGRAGEPYRQGGNSPRGEPQPRAVLERPDQPRGGRDRRGRRVARRGAPLPDGDRDRALARGAGVDPAQDLPARPTGPDDPVSPRRQPGSSRPAPPP